MRSLLLSLKQFPKLSLQTPHGKGSTKVEFDVCKCRECQFDASEESAVAARSPSYSLVLRVYKQSAGRSPVSVVPGAVSRASDMHPI